MGNNKATIYKYSKYNHSGTLSDGSVLVYNLFSSAVAILSSEEFDFLNREYIDESYNLELCQLAASQNIIVPMEEDELNKLLALKYTNNYNSTRAGFQILPTTACNARCFYCYEHGFETSTMDKETADATVKFILEYCEHMQEVNITWFGGEPFVCENTMEYISSKLIPLLEASGKRFSASVITNGSLINNINIEKIVQLYKIREIQITLDGRGKEYLRRKMYVNSGVTYEQILGAITLLTKNKVKVMVRLNVDRNNITECLGAIDDLYYSDADKDYLWPYAAPLYSDKDNDFCLSAEELNSVYEKIFIKLIDRGFISTINGLPMNFMNAACCAKILNNFVISPDGSISKCEHLLNCKDEVIGSVHTGICFNEAMARWNSPNIPDACKTCSDLPNCQAGCETAERRGFGYGRCAYVHFIHNAIVKAADYLLSEGGERNEDIT